MKLPLDVRVEDRLQHGGQGEARDIQASEGRGRLLLVGQER